MHRLRALSLDLPQVDEQQKPEPGFEKDQIFTEWRGFKGT